MNKKGFGICGGIILVFCLAAAGYGILMHLAYDRQQAEVRAELLSRVEELEKLLAEAGVDSRADEFAAECARGGYNYLAIGNSITKCPADGEMWWEEYGMAASSAEKDYYHLILEGLREQKGEVNSEAVLYYMWEIIRTNRAETYGQLDPYLNPELDLITVQLGENATELATFEDDMEKLIEHIKKACPDTRIIMIGDFWEFGGRDAMKEAVADRCNVEFVSLREIKDDADYQCGTGTVIMDSGGTAHEVTHGGVALHPNDRGMAYIADSVIQLTGE